MTLHDDNMLIYCQYTYKYLSQLYLHTPHVHACFHSRKQYLRVSRDHDLDQREQHIRFQSGGNPVDKFSS